jgi:uncharacterized membrane protein YfcA
MDHTTELWLTGLYTAIFGIGLGMLMQNLVLAVQNTVQASDIGSASASVAFFRSVGGAIGVSVLGAVMATTSRTWPPTALPSWASRPPGTAVPRWT